MNLSPIRSTLSRLSSSSLRKRQSDIDIAPYAREAQQEETEKQKKFQPLQFVLDVLNRGQYLTANIADEVEESFRTGRPLGESTLQTLRAAWEAVTGARKGDWETLLFGGDIGGTSEEAGKREGWIPGEWGDAPLIRYGKEGATGLAEGIFRPRKLIGLAANIALDPTTYMSFGGTKMAQQAATKYADDVVKLTLATMGPDEFAEIGAKAADFIGKSGDDIVRALSKSKAGARYIEGIYKNALQSAARLPAQKLVEDITPRLQKAAGRGGLEDLIARITPEAYEGAGTRAMKFFGTEKFKGERYPSVLRQWDMFKQTVGESRVGKKFGDAWWSVMNNGSVGSIRKALGFRNPYQQMLHLQQRNLERGVHSLAEDRTLAVQQFLSKYDDDIVNVARDARLKAENITSQLGMYGRQPMTVRAPGEDSLVDEIRQFMALNPGEIPTVETLLHWPEFEKRIGLKPEDIEKVRDIWGVLDNELASWWDLEKKATQAAGLPWDKEARLNYFPRKVGSGKLESGTMGRMGAVGTGAGGFTRQKKITGEQAIQNNADTFKFIMGDQLRSAYDELPAQEKAARGFDDFVRNWVKEKGLTDANIDLGEALQLRAIDHAQYMGRMQMIQDFRQFGIPIEDAIKAAPDIANKIQTFPGVSELGLFRVQVPGFEDYLFDSDVAQVLTNVGKIVSSDESTREFANLFGRYTAWWKGMVTMTPGFHARNAISNNITGFLKFGPRWFTDRELITDSIVGTAYALHPDNYMDMLTGALNTNKGFIIERLNRPVTGTPFTIQELGDYLRKRGIISHHSQVAEEIGQRAGTTLNPMSIKFKGFDISRSAGDVIENQSKFLSFLYDYTDLAKQGGDIAGSTAEKLATHKQFLEYAGRETDKWFIDYADLCFDKDTEILTDEGWKTIDSISYRHKALGFNLENGKMEWKPITYIHKAGYNGEMYHLTNTGFDAFVTPKHKWIKYGGDIGGHFTIPKPKWSLKETHYLFGTRKSIHLKLSDDSLVGADPFFSDDFVELCGWVITEGTYIQKGESIQVYQSESHNPHYCLRLKELAERMSSLGTIRILERRATLKKDIIVLYIGKGIAEYIRDWLPTKELTADFLIRLTRNQLELLYKILINGDGTRNKSGSEIFTQKSKITTDAIQMLGMMIGRRSVSRLSGDIWKTGIYVKEHAAYSKAVKVEIEHYSGKIWCIHTDNKTVIARRNGTVYLSGNTSFEQNVLKKVIPFWQWTRHNLANQISGIALYPNMYSLIPKVRGAIKDDDDFDYSLLPDYMENLGYYPIGKTAGGETIMRWANIPFEEINKIPLLFEGNRPMPNMSLREFATDVIANAHPMIKSVIEVASGKDLFRQRDIRGLERAPTLFQYLNKSPKVVEFLDGMLRKAGVREGLKIMPTANGTELKINGMVARLLENNLPVLKAIDMMIQTPETIAEVANPNVEKWIENISGKKDYYESLNEVFSLISQMFGWKFRGIVEAEEESKREEKLLARAEELKREARKQLPGYQRRREKSLQSRKKRASRLFQ